MADKTKIEWADATWGPVTGCVKVSQGCKHCYAERGWARLAHLPAYQGRAFTDVACHEDRLGQPLRWARPRKIFVNSMSDLFHEDVPDAFIDKIFAVMAISSRHIYQVLTKRPGRMLSYLNGLAKSYDRLEAGAQSVGYTLRFNGLPLVSWPLRNVWLGVSVEDQATADERLPLLLRTPATVRWISAEPLLGPLDLKWFSPFSVSHGLTTPESGKYFGGIGWVVCGGESGLNARSMHPGWARSLRDQCAAAGVPFLFKQWGEWAPNCLCDTKAPCKTAPRPEPGKPGVMFRCGKRAAGRFLDEVLHNEFPAKDRWST